MNAFLTLINIIVLVIFIVILLPDGSQTYIFCETCLTALGIGIVLACYYILSMEHIRILLHQQVTGSENIVGQGLRCIVANDCDAFNFHFYCRFIH